MQSNVFKVCFLHSCTQLRTLCAGLSQDNHVTMLPSPDIKASEFQDSDLCKVEKYRSCKSIIKGAGSHMANLC